MFPYRCGSFSKLPCSHVECADGFRGRYPPRKHEHVPRWVALGKFLTAEALWAPVRHSVLTATGAKL